VTVIGTKTALGASVPMLMSKGAVVVKGVGSIMPWWIGPIQSASIISVSSVVAPVIIVGGAAAVTYYYYPTIKSYTTSLVDKGQAQSKL